MEPEVVIIRMGKQNILRQTDGWKLYSKGHQLIVMMDMSSWESMGRGFNYRPIVNFDKVNFKLLFKHKSVGQDVEAMETEEFSKREPQSVKRDQSTRQPSVRT